MAVDTIKSQNKGFSHAKFSVKVDLWLEPKENVTADALLQPNKSTLKLDW